MANCSLEKSIDILRRAKKYQVVLPNGETRLLSDMDPYDVMEALMNTIDTIEHVDARLGHVAQLVADWQRSGSSKPKKKRRPGY